MNSYLLSIAAILFFAVSSNAQRVAAPENKEQAGKSKGVLLHFSLGGHLPGGDLADRFGVNGAIGGGLEFLTSKNWVFGLEGAFHFGSVVKEDPLSILRTPEGDIIGNDRAIATVRLQQRGMYLGAVAGQLIPIGDKRAGIRWTIGAGWAQHRIRILDDARTAAQLTGDYKKGYDRLSGGPALQQFIGWQNLGVRRELDWMAGFEFGQAFTQTRRDWDYSAMKKLSGQRLDLRFGIRLVFTLPMYVGNAEDVYY